MKTEEKISSERGVKKKRHGHNIQFWGLKRIARPSHMVGTICYSFQNLKLKIVAVLFFFWRLVFSWTDQFFRTRPSLTAYNSRSKPHTPNKFHIFGNVRTWGFTWTYLGYFFLWANFEEWAFYEKSRFLAFFHCRTEKNSNNFDSANIEVWRLAHSSFWNLCSTF